MLPNDLYWGELWILKIRIGVGPGVRNGNTSESESESKSQSQSESNKENMKSNMIGGTNAQPMHLGICKPMLQQQQHRD